MRDFTRTTGRLAKTDEIDAVAILQFADAMQTPASPVPSPEQVQLTDLVRWRRQLVDAAAEEKQRESLLNQPPVTSSIERHLALLTGEITAIDQAIAMPLLPT